MFLINDNEIKVLFVIGILLVIVSAISLLGAVNFCPPWVDTSLPPVSIYNDAG